MGDVKPWHLLKPGLQYAEEETRDKRLEICKSCPELIKISTVCKKCGCFMNIKTRIQDATCPIGKW